MTDERLRIGADGHVVLRLRHPWADGTTGLVFALIDESAVTQRMPEIMLGTSASVTQAPALLLRLYSERCGGNVL
jgi:hypothetical protein